MINRHAEGLCCPLRALARLAIKNWLGLYPKIWNLISGLLFQMGQILKILLSLLQTIKYKLLVVTTAKAVCFSNKSNYYKFEIAKNFIKIWYVLKLFFRVEKVPSLLPKIWDVLRPFFEEYKVLSLFLL